MSRQWPDDEPEGDRHGYLWFFGLTALLIVVLAFAVGLLADWIGG